MSDAGTKCSATATHELPGLALVGNLNDRLVSLGLDLERPVLLVPNDFGVIDFTANETFGVKDSVFGVTVVCVLCSVTDQTFVVRETDP